MKRRRHWFCSMLLALIIIIGMQAFTETQAHAFSNQVIQRGATGDDVIELQARLQYNGYFKGAITGVFSWKTYWALRNFQQKNGMKVDGLAGKTTKARLIRQTNYNKAHVMKQLRQGRTYTNNTKQNQATPAKKQASAGKKPVPSKNIPDGFSQNDLNLMANAVYGEARGEPYIGQVGVAAVIINRVKSAEFPNTVSGVIFEPGAFTAVSDGQIYLTPNNTAKKAVMDALNGWDPTGEALYYFNPDTATSSWIWTRPQIKKIGKHIYTK
ncbi:Spore cortex-lytic enzyme, lytic transglycosylase SleB [Fictibacillus macauensis ZFHKF-1]|uniref:Spore cortex-lytic enzyme n=1 Tax=Fictibacillus macauensis ZFHKF-1 TaxID=1196324 RepID=I8ALR6_9BACL|nr:spore cortex-lytic enzyme [Fictibacillus macauensis]EIT86569.1 Spore cortex-lytic enzyme, lytic transglycosylase SleB [Fictibacillus macauensis ZFHKF-1]